MPHDCLLDICCHFGLQRCGADWHLDAWKIGGSAACMKGDAGVARQALCQLEPLRQASMRFVCRSNHVELPGE